MIVFLLLALYFCLSVEGTRRCDNERDCRSFATFCGGPFLCNVSAWCDPVTRGYDPCSEARGYALAFTRRSKGKEVVSIRCVEELRECVELYYCVEDADCDDGLYCNGKERCLQGHCHPSSVAEPPPCTDTLRAEAMASPLPTAGEPADPGLTYAVVSIALVFLVLVVIFALILLFRSVDPSVMAR